MYRLTVVNKNKSVDYNFLKNEVVVAGRSPSADIQLDDEYASREHLRFFTEGNVVKVEDLRSSNGSTLNGRLLLESTPIADGDIIQISSCTITVSQIASIMLELDEHTHIAKDARTVVQESQPSYSSESFLNMRDSREKVPVGKFLYMQLLAQVNEEIDRVETTGGLLDAVAKIIGKNFQSGQVSILVKRPDGKIYEAAKCSTEEFAHETLMSKTINKLVMERGQAILVEDMSRDHQLIKQNSLMDIRSLVAVPLLEDLDPVGMIVLISRDAPGAFSEDDLEILVFLGKSIALKLRNYRLLNEFGIIQRELELAYEIQRTIISRVEPRIHGYDCSCLNIPSRGVSGDFYSILPVRGTALVAIAIVDVAGKGIPAALLAMSVEAMYSALLLEYKSLSILCRELSNMVYSRTTPEKYATGIFMLLNTDTNNLTYCNAGHQPAILTSATGQIKSLPSSGTPLGLIENMKYEQNVIFVNSRDVVLLYSDGVTEALNPEEEEFGLERLSALLVEESSSGSDTILRRIEDELCQYSKGLVNSDDRTIVLLKKN